MHYCLLLITKEMPSEDRISEILKPYDEEDLEYNKNGEVISFPIFTYNWWEIGGRYTGELLTKSKIDDCYCAGNKKEAFLCVDGAKIDKLLNFDKINCSICIDSDENVIARESWRGCCFIKDEYFDEKLAEIKKKSKGMFATILDIHS